jgi:hypothetical protein
MKILLFILGVWLCTIGHWFIGAVIIIVAFAN